MRIIALESTVMEIIALESMVTKIVVAESMVTRSLLIYCSPMIENERGEEGPISKETC